MNDGNARQNRITPRVIAFGDFELRLDTRELTKDGMRVRLPPQPFHILRTLAEQPGVVITRDELCRILWPPNTHVDFEAGLNTAMNRLRTALGDSAEHPIYIETVSRIGYRFIAPVKFLAPVLSIASERDNDLAADELTIARPPAVVERSALDRLRSAFRSVFAFCLRPFRTHARKERQNERRLE